jgi:hypothetical protein
MSLVGLTVLLFAGLIFLAVIGLNRADDANDDTLGDDDVLGCVFFAEQIGTVAYSQPISDAQYQQEALVQGIGYPVEQRTDTHYYISISDVHGGWVDGETGRLSGDCDDLPRAPNP